MAQCDAQTTSRLAELGIAVTATNNETPRLEQRSDGLHAICSDGSLHIDWLSGELHIRRHKATVNSEAVAKACGLNKTSPAQRTIIDLTAGLGRDGMVLASLGAMVTLTERSPWLAALLSDARQRAAAELDWLDSRLALRHISAFDFLPTAVADCAYLDPMYPPRKKSALVKQDLRLIRELVGTDEDANELLIAALDSGIKRVVSKRPAYASPSVKPTHTIESGATRFDVYLR